MLIKNKIDEYRISEYTNIEKQLLPKFLNRNILGIENQIHIQESIENKGMYEIHVSTINEKFKYIYSCGKASVTTVLRIAKKFNINLK
jgi:hypothetical protein